MKCRYEEIKKESNQNLPRSLGRKVEAFKNKNTNDAVGCLTGATTGAARQDKVNLNVGLRLRGHRADGTQFLVDNSNGQQASYKIN